MKVNHKNIDDLLPNSRQGLNWLINYTGLLLFNSKWANHSKVLIDGQCTMTDSCNDIIMLIGQYKNDKLNANDTVNYIFNASIQKRNSIN